MDPETIVVIIWGLAVVGSEKSCRGVEPDQDENRAGADGGIIKKYIIQIVYLY